MAQRQEKLPESDRENWMDPRVRQRYGVLCGAVGILLNLLLFAGKFLAGLLSRSVAVTADALNNLSDAASSLVTLVGFRMAGRRPDADHPFGHGRMEYIAGLIVSFLILLMAVELVRTSIGKIIHPQKILASNLVLLILLFSIAVKLFMCLYSRILGKRIASATLLAVSKDSISDCLATGAVFATALISRETGINADGYCGLLVSLFVAAAGLQAAKETIDPLLGTRPDPDFVKKVREIILSYRERGVLGIHDLIVHDYGPGRVMLTVHVEVPATGNLVKLHNVIDEIEHRLKGELHCEAVIHMDPVTKENEKAREIHEQVQSIIARMEGPVHIHDFRVVEGKRHTNIIFDVVVPYDYPWEDAKVQSYLEEEIGKLSPGYRPLIDVDKDLEGLYAQTDESVQQ